MANGKKLTRLAATALARRVHKRLQQEGELGKGMALPPAAPSVVASAKYRPPAKAPRVRKVRLSDGEEIGLSPTGTLEKGLRDAFAQAAEFLLQGAEKARNRRASVAVQANPLMGRKPDPSVHGPTAARVAKATHGVAEAKSSDNASAHVVRVRTAVQTYAMHFSDAEVDTARRFADDFEDACHVDVVSKIYSGMQGGGGDNARAGHIAENQRLAHARFNFLVRTLHPSFRVVAENLLLEISLERLGRPMNLEELAAKVSAYRNVDTRRAFSVGLMKSTLWRISEAYKAWDGHYERVNHNAKVHDRHHLEGAINDAVRHVKNSAPGNAPAARNVSRQAVAD